MASLPSSCTLIKPCIKHNSRRAMKVRAQSYGEEGRSSHIVDANLSVLRGRIKEIGVKERLERCYRSSCQYGWNYAPGYDCKLKKKRDLFECFELVRLVGGTFGIACLSGTAFLSLASILVHLNQELHLLRNVVIPYA